MASSKTVFNPFCVNAEHSRMVRKIDLRGGNFKKKEKITNLNI